MGLRGLFFCSLVCLGASSLTAAGQSEPRRVEAAPLNCGTTYEVESGDTFYRIAERTYADGWRFEVIQEANKLNDATLEVGSSLYLPCLDAQAEDEVLVAQVSGTEDALTKTLEQPTGTIAPVGPGTQNPFLDDLAATPEPLRIRAALRSDAGTSAIDQIMAELLSEALALAGREHQIDFVHEDDEGGWDLSLPWIGPHCGQLCAAVEISAPVYSIALSFHMRADEPLAQEPMDLDGRRICIPADQGFAGEMRSEALMASDAEIIEATTSGQCFAMLADRRIDAVALTGPAPRGTKAVEARALSRDLTFHIAIARSQADLSELVNVGLTDLKESGRWFQVVHSNLSQPLIR